MANQEEKSKAPERNERVGPVRSTLIVIARVVLCLSPEFNPIKFFEGASNYLPIDSTLKLATDLMWVLIKRYETEKAAKLFEKTVKIIETKRNQNQSQFLSSKSVDSAIQGLCTAALASYTYVDHAKEVEIGLKRKSNEPFVQSPSVKTFAIARGLETLAKIRSLSCQQEPIFFGNLEAVQQLAAAIAPKLIEEIEKEKDEGRINEKSALLVSVLSLVEPSRVLIIFDNALASKDVPLTPQRLIPIFVEALKEVLHNTQKNAIGNSGETFFKKVGELIMQTNYPDKPKIITGLVEIYNHTIPSSKMIELAGQLVATYHGSNLETETRKLIFCYDAVTAVQILQQAFLFLVNPPNSLQAREVYTNFMFAIKFTQDSLPKAIGTLNQGQSVRETYNPLTEDVVQAVKALFQFIAEQYAIQQPKNKNEHMVILESLVLLCTTIQAYPKLASATAPLVKAIGPDVIAYDKPEWLKKLIEKLPPDKAATILADIVSSKKVPLDKLVYLFIIFARALTRSNTSQENKDKLIRSFDLAIGKRIEKEPTNAGLYFLYLFFAKIDEGYGNGNMLQKHFPFLRIGFEKFAGIHFPNLKPAIQHIQVVAEAMIKRSNKFGINPDQLKEYFRKINEL